MLYVCSLFDPNRDSRPLATAVYDAGGHALQIYYLYLPKTGRTIYDIERDIDTIKTRVVSTDKVHINDFKRHLGAFAFDYTISGKIYDHPIGFDRPDLDIANVKKLLVDGIKRMKSQGESAWTKLRAEAAFVYQHLQRKGILFGYRREKTIWNMDTYSGRASTVGFNAQGRSAKDPIANTNGDTIFISYDWVAADYRIASLLSNDPLLLASFKGSDPYEFLAKHLNQGITEDLITRDRVKSASMGCLYSASMDNPALEFYQGLRQWKERSLAQLENQGYIESILGRRFMYGYKCDGKDRTILSALNAAIQGSVAHAMHACLAAIWKIYPDKLLLESHDSIVMTARKDEVRRIITDVKPIVMHPFRGILKDDPVFPVKVGCGTVYKEWKTQSFYE